MPRLSPLVLSFALAAGARAAGSLPDPAQVRPAPVLITNDYTEGVVVDREGNLYFSHGRVVTRLTPAGQASTWAETGGPNGHKVLPNGEHLVCDATRHAVLRLDENGQFLGNAASGVSGDLDIRSPNDLTLDPEGGFYFTDSVARTGAVHHVAPDGTKRVVARKIDFANGIALSVDRKRLYFAESRQNRILYVDLEAPGVAAREPRVFAELPKNTERPGVEDNQPDGVAFDREGRLWVAHYGMKSVQVLDGKGKLVRTYDGGNRTTSNLCFAGPKLDTLYVTGGEPGGLFRLDVKVPGLRLLRSGPPGG